MKVILRTSDFSEGLRIVEIIEVPKDNKGLIKVKDGDEVFYTGGILCRLHHTTFAALEDLSAKEQWELLLNIKFPLPFE